MVASVTRAEFKSQNQNKYQYEACHARYKNYDNYKLKQPSEQLTPGPLICYKRSNNLANTLVHARLRATKKPPRETFRVALKTTIAWRTNSSPCGKDLCRCCAEMSWKQNVFSTNDKTSRKTPQRTSCSSRTLVYKIECRKCYLGSVLYISVLSLQSLLVLYISVLSRQSLLVLARQHNDKYSVKPPSWR